MMTRRIDEMVANSIRVWGAAVLVATMAPIGATMARSSRQDSFRDAYAAYQHHDYKIAFEKFKILADGDDPTAQDNLATMYSNGWGVSKSEIQGVQWYRRAAAQGFPHAQLMLASYYGTGGPGIPQDFVLGYMWSSVAATHAGQLGDNSVGGREYDKAAKGATAVRDKIAALMTREQIAEAQKLVRDWQPKFEAGYVRDLQN